MNNLGLERKAFRALESRSITGRQVSGRLSHDEYQEIKSEFERLGYEVRSDNETCTIEFLLSSKDNEFFAIDMDDLLSGSTRRKHPPKEFYLADIDFLYQGEVSDLPEVVRCYFGISKFISVLIDLADHEVKGINPKAIFLHGQKIELPLTFTSDDLESLSELDGLISDFFEAEIHKGQKTTIIKDVLLEMLKNNEIDRFTLPCLIRRFNEFRDRINANYQLYVSEFSFEKIKEQVQKEQFEFTLKLNKVFSDVQNQLLAVPLALFLISSQMESMQGYSIKNVVIWCSSIVFGIFMSLLVRNQKSNLRAIKQELDSQRLEIRKRHKFVEEKLGSHYEQLNLRHFMQRCFLTVVSIIIALSVAGSTLLLLYKSSSLSAYKEVLTYGSYAGGIYLLACFMYWYFFTRKKFS